MRQLVLLGMYAPNSECSDIHAVASFPSSTLGSTGLGAGKFTATMAWVGQTATHLRHRRHLFGSIYEQLLPTVIAPNGHSFSHLPQPIQLTLQAFMATAPLSLLTQDTYTLLPFGPFLRNSMMPRGQVFTQAPQATHRSSSTSAMPVSGLM